MLPDFIQREFNYQVARIIPARKFSRVLFLAGTGRSGTTWLAETINHDKEFRTYFEPFYNRKVPQFSNLSYRPYFRPDLSDSKLLDSTSKLLEGKGLNRWILSRDRNPFAKKLLIKDIRANLMLGYLKKNFPYIRFILLLRHPVDVALSKIKLGWETHLEVFLNQPDLMKDYLSPFKTILENAADGFDKHVALWCVENYVPFQQFRKDELHVIFYERLISNPKEELEKLYQFIDEPLKRNIFDSVAKRSSTDWNKPVLNEDTGLKKYNEEHISVYRKYADAFGLSPLYGHDEKPDPVAAQQLFKQSSL